MDVSPRHQLVEQILPKYRKWLYAVARDICGPAFAQHHEDVAQEGYIAMWRAVGTFDPDLGAAPSYLTHAAMMRMTDVARRGFKTWTGRDPMRGSRDVSVATSVERLREGREDFDVEDVLSALMLDHAAFAYHEGEISAALDRLTERERRYVYARFWYDMPVAEIDAMFGVRSLSIWNTAKPKLREDLAHLVAP